ncbi:MAG TPA: extracellular solute-binding protein [Trichocoleus sp.]|jgi:putative spermidine/putrescine transport system substrate-binding protein
MNRRSFLTGAGTLALSYALVGCGQSNPDLRVRLLEDSIPPELLKEFQRRVAKGKELALLPGEQLADLFQLLQTWNPQPNDGTKPASGLPLPFVGSKPTPVADLITLGDYWLAPAIQQGLVQPFQTSETSAWEKLPAQWQTLVKRDRQGKPDANGETWAAPYRWGTLMIAYRRDAFQKLGWTPQDWKDLWRSELQRYISLPDTPRAVIGLTLKKLGRSVNLANLSEVSNLTSELEALQQQVKFYGSQDYLQPLLLNDTWAAVGWSTEILPIVKRDRRIAAVVPSSGTILTADLWVRPVKAPESDNADRRQLQNQWINFYWQPQIATQLSLLSLAASPILMGSDRSQLPEALRQNPVLPPEAVLQRSEFLLPLSEQTTQQYQQMWATVRQAAVRL